MKKERLEKYLDDKSGENESAKLQLEKEIEEIKTALEETPPRTTAESFKKWTLQLIETMEKKLECPVCFELASAPMFCCPEQHLICSECLPKVKRFLIKNLGLRVLLQVRDCPLCRIPYPAKPIRNRLMEETAQELEIMRQMRATLLGS